MTFATAWSYVTRPAEGLGRAVRVLCLFGLGVAATYAGVFAVLGQPIERIVESTFVNLSTLMVLAVVVWTGARALGAAPTPVRILAHIVAAPLFGLAWYLSVIVIYSLTSGLFADGFTVRTFYTSAAMWQLLQGVAVYALIALLAVWPEPVAAPVAEAESLTRLFVRSGDEIAVVEVDDIIRIQGRDDYSEVVTPRGSRLARTSLAELERTLPGQRFLRVHRSHIVNIDRMDRAEPAGGGRLTLHMADGVSVTTSRAGARLVRDRIV